jgi:hypothetical protein
MQRQGKESIQRPSHRLLDIKGRAHPRRLERVPLNLHRPDMQCQTVCIDSASCRKTGKKRGRETKLHLSSRRLVGAGDTSKSMGMKWDEGPPALLHCCTAAHQLKRSPAIRYRRASRGLTCPASLRFSMLRENAGPPSGSCEAYPMGLICT